jgi:hypothetical protein
MPGLSDEGFALVMEMYANNEINLDAILAYVDRTESDQRNDETARNAE